MFFCSLPFYNSQGFCPSQVSLSLSLRDLSAGSTQSWRRTRCDRSRGCFGFWVFRSVGLDYIMIGHVSFMLDLCQIYVRFMSDLFPGLHTCLHHEYSLTSQTRWPTRSLDRICFVYFFQWQSSNLVCFTKATRCSVLPRRFLRCGE